MREGILDQQGHTARSPHGGRGFCHAPILAVVRDTTHEPTRRWQAVENALPARQPEHRCDPPVPVTARVQWERDGAEPVDTVALGWSGRAVWVRIYDPRCQTKAIWLRAEDVRRR